MSNRRALAALLIAGVCLICVWRLAMATDLVGGNFVGGSFGDELPTDTPTQTPTVTPTQTPTPTPFGCGVCDGSDCTTNPSCVNLNSDQGSDFIAACEAQGANCEHVTSGVGATCESGCGGIFGTPSPTHTPTETPTQTQTPTPNCGTSPFVVTLTTDTACSGNCTAGELRWAITCANAGAGGDSITFNVAGAGPHTITLGTILPMVTADNTTIDGTTQAGTVCTSGSIAPMVVLDANHVAWPESGGIIRMDADGATVKGLRLTGNDVVDAVERSGLTVGSLITPRTGIVIDCIEADHNATYGISLAGTPGATVTNCSLHDNGSGMLVEATTGATTTIGPGNIIEVGTSEFGAGINVGNSSSIEITGNTFLPLTPHEKKDIVLQADVSLSSITLNTLCASSNITDVSGDNTISDNTFVCPTPTPIPPRCCQVVDGVAAGHPGNTCIDEAWLAINGGGLTIAFFGGCDGLAAAIGTTATADFPVSCDPEADLGGTCRAAATETPTQTPTVTPTPPASRRHVVRRYGNRYR